MQGVHLSDKKIERWAATIQTYGLVDVALLMLDLVPMWRFIGIQTLWMLAPFVGRANASGMAETLESSKALQKLRQCLTEGKN